MLELSLHEVGLRLSEYCCADSATILSAMHKMKKRYVILAIMAVVCIGITQYGCVTTQQSVETQSTGSDGDRELGQAFANHESNIEVEGSGVVTKILADDNDGSRHQRFIVRLGSGQTLLVAHNIDIANRIDSLKEEDQVFFKGEYEWNPKGGIVHFTHHDPQGRHPSGWIKHKGQTYQ